MLTLSAEDIEAAYERALQAVTTAEKSIGFDDVDPIEEVTPADVVPAPTSVEDESTPVESSAGDNQADQDIIADVTEAGGGRIQPRQVLEAALFVGGDSLTTKRLGMMLGEGISAEEVEELIASLNAQYADEHRPYEIRLSEGGYRLVLLEEFEAVQSRVYGTNPKDVKLSQEALEVLAFVAYRQPVTSDDLEETEKPNAMSLLRQLMRRQLVKLERDESNASAVTYHTTPRFLELFGLRSLNDLPFPEDLVLK
ncbi:MAG: SMC-Scp complex subunit ScpB [Planctomycetaceae bacterium]|nr:SMC-Scp complex subunit ScpB [Planctomycetaceae bacterium]